MTNVSLAIQLSLSILDWPWYRWPSLYRDYTLSKDSLQGHFRLCGCLSLRCLVHGITICSLCVGPLFEKSNLHELTCNFDISKNMYSLSCVYIDNIYQYTSPHKKFNSFLFLCFHFIYFVLLFRIDLIITLPNGCIYHLNLYITVMYMMTSSNWNIFRDTGPLCGKFTGHGWIPITKASDAELWCFLWSAPDLTLE